MNKTESHALIARFGAIVRGVMTDDGVSLDQVAEAIDVTPATLSKKLDHLSRLNSDEMFKICEFLNVKASALMEMAEATV